jgi:hypothetical protein
MVALQMDGSLLVDGRGTADDWDVLGWVEEGLVSLSILMTFVFMFCQVVDWRFRRLVMR